MSRKIVKPVTPDASSAAVILALLDININGQFRLPESPDHAIQELQSLVEGNRNKAAVVRLFNEGLNSAVAVLANTARQVLRAHGVTDEELLSPDSPKAGALLQKCGDVLKAEAEAAQEAAKTEAPVDAE